MNFIYDFFYPYFAKDFQGEPFILFNTPHTVFLATILGIIILMFIFKKKILAAQGFFRYLLAIILIVNELAWHVWNAVTGQWTIQTMLPFHLCSVLVWLCAFMLITKKYVIYEFAYFLGIGGGLQALLTPDAGIYGYPHFRFFQTLISHGCIVISAIFMTTIIGLRPTWKSVFRVIIGMNIYMLLVGLLNWVIGSNYLFIAHKPETPSLIDMLGPWPWYILGLELIGVLMVLILYVPFFIKDRFNLRRASTIQQLDSPS